MLTFSLRLKKTRLAKGLSQQALADAISKLNSKKAISRTAITQWESGHAKGIEAANLLHAAKVLKVNPEWLQFGTGSMTVPPNDDLKSPLAFMEVSEFIFSLTIHDTSMEPAFIKGDLAIIDKRLTPEPGDFVAVQLPQQPQLTLRRYRLSEDATTLFELIADNPDWPRYVSTPASPIVIVGTLIEHRCKRRTQTPAENAILY